MAGDVREFPEPVPTADAAAAALGCDTGAIANSLVFEADGTASLSCHRGNRALVLTSRRLITLGHRVTVAHTGQHVGGVAPIGHPRPLRTVVDLALASYPVIWAGAGDERLVFATSFDELVKITSGTPSDVD